MHAVQATAVARTLLNSELRGNVEHHILSSVTSTPGPYFPRQSCPISETERRLIPYTYHTHIIGCHTRESIFYTFHNLRYETLSIYPYELNDTDSLKTVWEFVLVFGIFYFEIKSIGFSTITNNIIVTILQCRISGIQNEAQRRGVRAFVRTAQPETGDLGCGCVDLPRSVRWAHRMGRASVCHIRHEILVAGALVPGVDISGSVSLIVQHSKVNV